VLRRSGRTTAAVSAGRRAQWAWHGVDVLLRIYAKCVVGHGDLAKRRISEVLRQN